MLYFFAVDDLLVTLVVLYSVVKVCIFDQFLPVVFLAHYLGLIKSQR